MPLVVIPSEITNFGAITLAEAQSARFYTDSTLVTEVAREVVSADELHFKSTVTSSSEYWVDYDGIRADYAVGATYGRNAVWGDYEFVSHDGANTDSTGNHTTSKFGGVSGGAATSNIGAATDFDGTNDYITDGDIDVGKFTVSVWLNSDVWVQRATIITKSLDVGAGRNAPFWMNYNDGADWDYFGTGIFTGSAWISVNTASAPSTGTWHSFCTTKDASNLRLYWSGSEVDSTPIAADYLNDRNWSWGAAANWGNTTFSFPFNGKIGETRIKSGALPPDWITTEYNNQSDNGAFWVAEDVGPAPSGTFGLKLGSTTINKVMLGSTEIKKIYLGTTVIYENL